MVLKVQSLTDQDTVAIVCLESSAVTGQSFESKLSIRHIWKYLERQKETPCLLIASTLTYWVDMLKVQTAICYETVGQNQGCY